MLAKAVLVACAQVFLIQTAFSACAGGRGGYGIGYNGLAGGCGAGLIGGYGAGLAGGYAGCGCGAGVASTGGGLPIASASPIAPVGISVLSENVYEGQLCAGGNLPFLGTVGIEGVLPTAGAGAVSYGCGDGAIGIGAEGPIGTGITSGRAFAPSAGLINQGIGAAGYGLGGIGLGYGAGIGGCGARVSGCGCGGRLY